MDLSFFGIHKNETILIFYVDSSSVGAAVVCLSKEAKPHVLWSRRQELAFQEDPDFARFQTATIDALKIIMTDCAKRSPVHPDRFVAVLSSPWFVSQTRVAAIKSDKPFSVTENLIKQVIADEVNSFEQERMKSNDVILQKENSIIEVRTMQMALNGYPTNKPHHHKVTDLQISVFISMSSNNILNAFRSVVTRSFHANTVEFHTLPFVVFSTLRDIVPGPEQFIFIDINGEITDLSIVNHGIIMETISFPLGYNFLLRRVAKTFTTTIEQARTLLETHSANQLHGAYTSKLESDVVYAKQEWLKSMARVLELSSFDYLLPDNAYIVGHRSTINHFASFISDETLKQYTITNKPFTVKIINTDLLKQFCIVNPIVQSDVFLFLPAIFQQKVFRL